MHSKDSKYTVDGQNKLEPEYLKVHSEYIGFLTRGYIDVQKTRKICPIQIVQIHQISQNCRRSKYVEYIQNISSN